jgi:hypothetical protein
VAGVIVYMCEYGFGFGLELGWRGCDGVYASEGSDSGRSWGRGTAIVRFMLGFENHKDRRVCVRTVGWCGILIGRKRVVELDC